MEAQSALQRVPTKHYPGNAILLGKCIAGLQNDCDMVHECRVLQTMTINRAIQSWLLRGHQLRDSLCKRNSIREPQGVYIDLCACIHLCIYTFGMYIDAQNWNVCRKCSNSAGRRSLGPYISAIDGMQNELSRPMYLQA